MLLHTLTVRINVLSSDAVQSFSGSSRFSQFLAQSVHHRNSHVDAD